MGFAYDCWIEAISDAGKQVSSPCTLDTGSVDHATGRRANPANPDSFQVPDTQGLWDVPACAQRVADAVEEKAGLADVGRKLRSGWSSRNTWTIFRSVAATACETRDLRRKTSGRPVVPRETRCSGLR